MERTKVTKKSHSITYEIPDEPLIISKYLLDTFLKQDAPGDVIALYTFYYYTAKWQKTNKPKSTTTYAANGLKWSLDRTRKTKKVLIELGLIDDIVHKHEGTGKILGHFIHVNFVYGRNHPMSKPDSGANQTVVNSEGNTLKTNTINAKKTNNINASEASLIPLISTDLFETFWKLYPRKDQKGQAQIEWEVLCAKPKKERLAWHIVRDALRAQKKTKRWGNPMYIPYAKNWLALRQWMNDVGEMNKLNGSKPKTNSTGYKQQGKTYRKADAEI